jgi:hypothetical protein
MPARDFAMEAFVEFDRSLIVARELLKRGRAARDGSHPARPQPY